MAKERNQNEGEHSLGAGEITIEMMDPTMIPEKLGGLRRANPEELLKDWMERAGFSMGTVQVQIGQEIANLVDFGEFMVLPSETNGNLSIFYIKSTQEEGWSGVRSIVRNGVGQILSYINLPSAVMISSDNGGRVFFLRKKES